jgi:hypothetical protein
MKNICYATEDYDTVYKPESAFCDFMSALLCGKEVYNTAFLFLRGAFCCAKASGTKKKKKRENNI